MGKHLVTGYSIWEQLFMLICAFPWTLLICEILKACVTNKRRALELCDLMTCVTNEVSQNFSFLRVIVFHFTLSVTKAPNSLQRRFICS